MMLTVDMMSTMDNDFPLIEVPSSLLPRLGEVDPGTRMYRRYGTEADFADWWDAVLEACGEESCVSPGGVAMYARVSRAGVHKRMKEGRITAFLFHVVKGVSRWTKREILDNAGQPYAYIPCEECKAWAKIMKEKMDRKGRKLESFGDGDFNGDFMMSKGRKRQ